MGSVDNITNADNLSGTAVLDGTRRRDFLVFAASKEKQLISSIELDSPTSSTPVAANGVLYVTTMKKLYALTKSAE